MTAVLPNTLVFLRGLHELQNKLVAAFCVTFPAVQDWRFLLDAPKAGELVVDGEKWSFRKHGAGIAFSSQTGTIVDIHRNVDSPELVDAWRLVRYIESVNEQGNELTEAEVEAELLRLVKSGVLVPTEHDRMYRLL